MWWITSRLVEDRIATLRAEADHERLVAIARRARKAARQPARRAPAQPEVAAIPAMVRMPSQRTDEADQRQAADRAKRAA
jgi:hypothetical protein